MSGFYCKYDLKTVNLSNKVPANHQKEALAKLKEWFNKQHDGSVGGILAFEQRQEHDLDALAQKFINERLDRILENQNLKTEYERTDRYWSVIYPKYHRFKEEYDECVNRILNPIESPTQPPPSPPNADNLDDYTKQAVKTRDGYHCLCCGETRLLVVDHIKPRYYGGTHSLNNLQTLCSTCNSIKGTETLDFRNHQTSLNAPPSKCFEVELPLGENEKLIRRSINFFYRAAAVKSVRFVGTLNHCYNWEINLYRNNNPRWVIPYFEKLVEEIRPTAGYARPNKIIITAPGFDVVAPINGYFS